MIWTPPGPIGRDEARDLARRELRKSIYHRDEPSFIDRILRKINDWLTSFFGNTPGSDSGGIGGWVSLVILIVLLVVVIAVVWWRVGNVGRNVAEAAPLLDDTPTTAKDHRAEAERYAAAGEWPQAIRERLRAIARDLEERAILDPRPGRTADELAAEAGAALPDHADDLAGAVRLFDDVWYGGRRGDSSGYQLIKDLDQRLRGACPVPLAARSGR